MAYRSGVTVEPQMVHVTIQIDQRSDVREVRVQRILSASWRKATF